MIRGLDAFVVLKCLFMECEEFFICLPTRHLEILCHNQRFVVTVDRDQEQSSLTLTVLIVQWQGVITTGGVNIVTRVITGQLAALARWYLLIYWLTFWSCLKKE